MYRCNDTLSGVLLLSNCNQTPTKPDHTEIGRSAALHDAELLRLGYTLDQVVRDYGDVCQAVTELAGEEDERITAGEFRTLNRCLDNAIADAVTSFEHARQILIMIKRSP